MPQKEEFEFKYEIPQHNKDSVLEEIRGIQKIRSYQIGKSKKVKLEDEYLDTPNFSLLDGGFLSRIRKKDNNEKLITVKELIERKDSSLNRQEFEEVFNKKNIQRGLGILSNRGIIKKVPTAKSGKEILQQSELEIILKVENNRKVRNIKKNNQNVGEFSLDDVTFEKENEKAEYWGIEIEASSKKHTSDIKQVSTALMETLGKKLNKTNLTKFEKGLELFSLKEKQ